MRAYMSDKTRGTHTQRGYAPPSWAGEAAVAEACAILAETEGGVPCDARNLPGIFRSGVASLVSAFVGTTFPGEVCRCAQGRHWSPERGYFDCGGIVQA